MPGRTDGYLASGVSRGERVFVAEERGPDDGKSLDVDGVIYTSNIVASAAPNAYLHLVGFNP